MKSAALIVSAGKGYRFSGEKKKQFLTLAGKPILCHTLEKFETCPSIDLIQLVVGQEDMDYTLKEIVEAYGYRKISQIVPGGKVRQESVKNGIDTLAREVDIVVIHDGVRPFVTHKMIEESIQTAKQSKAAVVAMPVKETIKMVGPDQTILKTLDRESLWQIQTPQTFRADVIRKALHKAAEDGFIGTDDASLVERIGIKVYILPGSYHNIKITTPEDLILASLLLQMEIA
ncbi:MAG: 2-C-methyl-D-erythritol 4-phosphate cytidylyltransferase [Deltaproteobacteria bacterium RBG_16_48_10]|nr:MAG: 2-C-methyl-D-erythritol 4-phosphate cytidylyltransferase [Deltaproteobacteria bacterium RBG_16_48_10]